MNHINEVIAFLQSIKDNNGVISEIKIDYGFRDLNPSDEGYDPFFKSKKPDGSFSMVVYGLKGNK